VNAYTYAISLRIEHPSIDPGELTRILGRSPDRAWRAGEPRTIPLGALIGPYQRGTYWTVRLVHGAASDPSLATAIDGTVRDLARHAPLLRRVRAEGGRAELFIGWFFERNSGDELPAALLSTLGQLGLDLSFDIYAATGPSST
jgi:hypothetical protein